jgi:hypothetical protein
MLKNKRAALIYHLSQVAVYRGAGAGRDRRVGGGWRREPLCPKELTPPKTQNSHHLENERRSHTAKPHKWQGSKNILFSCANHGFLG